MIYKHTLAFVCLLLNISSSLTENLPAEHQKQFTRRLLIRKQFVSWDKSNGPVQRKKEPMSLLRIGLNPSPAGLLGLTDFKKLKRFLNMAVQCGVEASEHLLAKPQIRDLPGTAIRHWTAQGAGIKLFQSPYILVIAVDKKWSSFGWIFFWTGFSLLFNIVAAALLYRRYKKTKCQNWFAQQQHSNLKQSLYSIDNTKDLLEQKLQLQTHLLASISHDIKTPMGFVSISAKEIKLLVEKGQQDNVIEFAEMIAFSADEIVNHVQHMTSFIKSSMQEDQILFSDVAIRELLLQKKKLFAQTIGFQKAMLAIEVEGNLTVKTNPELLGVLIHNLIDNALKVKRGNEIKIYSQTASGKLHLFIRDSGPGMSATLLNWLSDEPRSNENLSRDEGSSRGLGLIMVKEIARMLSIKIQAENTGGTTICLIFDR